MKPRLYPAAWIKRGVLYPAAIAACLLSPPSRAETAAATNTPQTAIVIPVEGMIGRGLLYVMRRGIEQAEEAETDLLILHMDTPGGAVKVTEEIIRMLLAVPAPTTTCTLVDPDALSAGSLIATATKDIYMTPSSRIGASAVVTSFGDIEEGDMKEKFVSSLTALVRSAARRNGHDPALIEAMIRRDAEYKIGDEVICPEGELLTLSGSEAARTVGEGEAARPLLAAGLVKDLDALLDRLGVPPENVQTIEQTWSESVARWIEMFSILFLAGGLLGLYVEFKVPGFGLPGILGIACLVVFFWGHHVAGLAGMEELIVFAIGVTLLLVEILFIPGFGVAGVTGIFFVLISLAMAMVQHYPGGGWVPPTPQLETAAANLSITLIVAFLGMIVLGRFLPETRAFKRLTLASSTSRAAGYQATRETDTLVGREGVAATDLRPGGIGQFGDERINIVSHGEFISRGTRIVVAEARGIRIVVEPLEETS